MHFALPPRWHRHRHEAVAVAIAVVGVGMFIGDSIIGPLISHQPGDPAADSSRALGFEAMMKRPDPFALRTPTPEFDVSGAPHYAAAARQKALAALGEAPDADAAPDAADDSRHGRRHRRTRMPDRHRVY
jgi:hypothetical protein